MRNYKELKEIRLLIKMHKANNLTLPFIRPYTLPQLRASFNFKATVKGIPTYTWA
jgi:hypothetical protein